MLNKKDFLKYASKLAFPIMIQNLIGTLVNIADTVMLGYVSQTAMSASSLANQYTFILFCLYYGMATGTSVLCAQYWGKGDKKTVERILGLAERISLIVSFIFFVISFTMPVTVMKIFTNSPDTIAAGSEYLKVISFSFMFMGFSQVFMSALRSVGKIMLPSITYIVSLCVNVLCNATFIFGLFGLPKLGVTGVALGTVIARIAEVLICLIYSLNKSNVRFRIKYFFAKSGILFQDFYAMPAIVVFLIALAVAFLQNRGLKFNEKMHLIAEELSDDNIITMCLIFLAAGAFSGAVRAAGGVESTVNLGLSILPGNMAVAGLFAIGCFISISMGTSVGTITALAPIAAGISDKTGFPMAICAGAVVCGAMFGDNLSIISDTTIAAVKTQGCDMRDKFRENFKIVLPAAIITLGLFYFLGNTNEYQVNGNLDYSLIKVLPYLFVLIGAVSGVNVFVILIIGTVLSMLVGLGTGMFTATKMFTHVGNGIMSMYDITVISIIVACIITLIKEYGGIDFVLNFIKSRISSTKGGELGIAALALLVDICTANNTVAIVMAGPIAKDISEEFDVTPRRSASLLDMFSSMGQGLIPYGAQLLAAASLTGLNPFAIIPYCFYPLLMGISGLIFIFIKNKD